MPYQDSDYGEWNEEQYKVPDRPSWLDNILKNKTEDTPHDVSLYNQTRWNQGSASATKTTPKKEKIYQATPGEKDREEAIEKHKGNASVFCPCLHDFRDWYFKAKNINANESDLKDIEKLANRFKEMTPECIFFPAQRNKKFGLNEIQYLEYKEVKERYSKAVEDFLNDARVIIDFLGKPDSHEEKGVRRRVRRINSVKAPYEIIYFPSNQEIRIFKENQLLYSQVPGKIVSKQEKVFLLYKDQLYFRNTADKLRREENF